VKKSNVIGSAVYTNLRCALVESGYTEKEAQNFVIGYARRDLDVCADYKWFQKSGQKKAAQKLVGEEDKNNNLEQEIDSIECDIKDAIDDIEDRKFEISRIEKNTIRDKKFIKKAKKKLVTLKKKLKAIK
jgi:peptidoglycan hydrolase CwlO-like protein